MLSHEAQVARREGDFVGGQSVQRSIESVHCVGKTAASADGLTCFVENKDAAAPHVHVFRRHREGRGADDRAKAVVA